MGSAILGFGGLGMAQAQNDIMNEQRRRQEELQQLGLGSYPFALPGSIIRSAPPPSAPILYDVPPLETPQPKKPEKPTVRTKPGLGYWRRK